MERNRPSWAPSPREDILRWYVRRGGPAHSHEENGFADRGPVGGPDPGNTATGGKLTIKPLPNGPLLLSGNLTIRVSSGRQAWRGTGCALCRCGHSNNRPFCDGSHRTAGFRTE